MALKPPSRGGSNSGIGQGINRRRSRLSEMLVKQTYGGAADSVLTDRVLASVTSENKTGSVTGTVTFSGTVVGKEGVAGAVTGSIAYTGTIVGKEGEPGAVVGTTTYSGTAAGTKAAQGATASEVVYSGVITGTKYDPDTPTTPTTGGGGRPQYRPYIVQQPAPVVEHRSGTVTGRIRFHGTVTGRKTSTARRLAAPVLYRCSIRGSKSARGDTFARTEMRGRIRGHGVTTISTAEIRRMRQEIELAYLMKGRP